MSPPTVDSDSIVADEQTALLPAASDIVEKPTPLPKLQITILLLLLLAEPMTSQCILPFINQLVRELDITGGDESKVGYYAGLVVSLFFATESITIMWWSRLSDHIGRKPVLLMGLFGLCISMIFFGLSQTFWAVVVSRCLAGLLNGNVGVMKSMMAELTDSTNIAQGFSLLPVTWSIGVTLGPVIGGTLIHPYDHFPAFSNPFWKRYPYFLPCLVSAAFSAIAFLACMFFLEETVTNRRFLKATLDLDVERTSRSRNTVAIAPVPLRDLLTFPVIISISNYGSLAFLEIAMLALLPLFYSSPIEYGGLGLPPSAIGILMGVYGLINGLFQAFYFPKVVKRWGVKRIFLAGMIAFLPIYLLFPVINLLARRWGLSLAVWMVLASQFLIMIIMDTAFGCIFIFMASAAPNKRSLGATNGLGQSVISVLRAIGPATSTSLYAFSVEHNLFGGYAVYMVLFSLSAASLLLAIRLPKEPWGSK